MFLGDGDDLGLRAVKERSLGDGRGGQAGFLQAVGGDDVQLRARLEDIDQALLAGEIDFAARGHGRRGKGITARAEAFLIKELAGGRPKQ